MVLAGPAVDGDADEDARRVDGNVERRRVPAANKVLVELVARRVRDGDERRGDRSRERTQEQRAEDPVLGRVGQLAQDQIPGPEARAEVRDRRQREDHRSPGDDG